MITSLTSCDSKSFRTSLKLPGLKLQVWKKHITNEFYLMLIKILNNHLELHRFLCSLCIICYSQLVFFPVFNVINV